LALSSQSGRPGRRCPPGPAPGLNPPGRLGAVAGVGGVVVVYGVPLLDRFKIDDVVGAIPVHLFAGIWGTVAVVLTNPDASLGTQIYSIIVVGLFVVVTTSIVWMVVKAISGIRVSSDDELQGLDTSELGMEAYPEFAQTN